MNWKTIGIVAAFIGVIVLIIWAIKKASNVDVVTGASNYKIKKSAESLGVPKEIAEVISEAPDSGAAARSIGVPQVLATAISNGVILDNSPTINGHVMQFNNGCTRSCIAQNSTQTGNWYANANGNFECSGLAGPLKCGGDADLNAVPWGNK